jgi:hypothetical protein
MEQVGRELDQVGIRCTYGVDQRIRDRTLELEPARLFRPGRNLGSDKERCGDPFEVGIAAGRRESPDSDAAQHLIAGGVLARPGPRVDRARRQDLDVEVVARNESFGHRARRELRSADDLVTVAGRDEGEFHRLLLTP